MENNSKPSEEVVKVVQALYFLIKKSEQQKMNRLKLIKLLWIADRRHIRRYGRTVSETGYAAMPHGPVASLALDIARKSQDFIDDNESNYIDLYLGVDNNDTVLLEDPGDDYLSETDKEALSYALEKFGDADPFVLADTISHEYPEWIKHEEEVNLNRTSCPIDMVDFFENKNEPDEFFNESDEVLSAAKETYEENTVVESLFYSK